MVTISRFAVWRKDQTDGLRPPYKIMKPAETVLKLHQNRKKIERNQIPVRKVCNNQTFRMQQIIDYVIKNNL